MAMASGNKPKIDAIITTSAPTTRGQWATKVSSSRQHLKSQAFMGLRLTCFSGCAPEEGSGNITKVIFTVAAKELTLALASLCVAKETGDVLGGTVNG
jgi:hypothetical protein